MIQYHYHSRFSKLLATTIVGLVCASPMVPHAAPIDLGHVWAEVDVGSAVGFDPTSFTVGSDEITFTPGPSLFIPDSGGISNSDFALNINFVTEPGWKIVGYEVTGSGSAGRGAWSDAWMTGTFAVTAPFSYTGSNSYTGEPVGGSAEAWSMTLPVAAAPTLSLAGTLGVSSSPVTNEELVGTHTEIITEPVFEWREVIVGWHEHDGMITPIYGLEYILVGFEPRYIEIPDFAFVTRGTPASMSLDAIEIHVIMAPEPQVAVMLVAGIGLLAWRMRCRSFNTRF